MLDYISQAQEVFQVCTHQTLKRKQKLHHNLTALSKLSMSSQQYTTGPYQYGQDEILPSSLLFHNPEYYIAHNDITAFQFHISIPQHPHLPDATILNQLAHLISTIPSHYQEINLVDIIALDYLSYSRVMKLRIRTRQEWETHEEYLWHIWRDLKDNIFNIPPHQDNTTPPFSVLNNIARIVWQIDPSYQKLNLANVVALDLLCRMRADRIVVWTGEELEKHNKYVRQMWWSLRE
jgi:hypothetical protein